MVSAMADTTDSASDLPEPIAIVGMGCRFAGGADSPAAFWQLLADGRDGVSEIPAERWAAYVEASTENAIALRDTTRQGGFLDDISGFDATFFGMLPREVEQIDPQHRMMLEVTWEALEHAGIPPHSLAGSDTGVYVGIGTEDYGRRLMEDLPNIEAWTGIGSVHCAAANRVSYTLDLRGPSLAVGTACSSSLVAVNLACQALAGGQTSLAIVGGVNAMAHPAVTMIMDAAGAISPDGRSKAFDASADGYGRGEGAGAIVLKRLADALADGDRVCAVIRGSAVMQDGRTNGIMQPSEQAQADVLRVAYRASGVAPDSVSYVEAHGTGTAVGDPIEAGALADVLGAGRPADAPLLIGSVKTNIGHLEAGAGVAGMIKTVLALQHRQLPPSLNVRELNPSIPWDCNGLRVVTELTPWPSTGGPRRAGVSGYGFGGTIGHVILEEAPARVGQERERQIAPWVFPISGATTAGLRAGAARLADWLADTDAELASVGNTLTAHRSHLTERAAIVAGTTDELVARLRSVAGEEEVDGVATGTAPQTTSDAVWVFAGQGGQWVGMGRELLATEPAFAAVFDELDPIYTAELGVAARDLLALDELTGAEVLQPITYAVQVALAAVWRRYGARPSATMGHSIGELAATVTAGGLSVADGARLACRRALMMRPAVGKGAMALAGISFADAERQLAGRSDVMAAIEASPVSTVISGDPAAVAEVAAAWEADGLVVRRVNADIAFHSPQMDQYAARIPDLVADIVGCAPHVPIYSTSLPDPRAWVDRGVSYWPGNLRNPVRFAQAVTAAVEDGHRCFLEVSSHPIVSHSINETLSELGVDDVAVVSTLRRDRPDRRTLLDNLATLHCHGVRVDLGTFFPDGELVDLPTSAWQRRRYWRESRVGGGGGGALHDPRSHTLLGKQTTVAGGTPLRLWQTCLDVASRPYPGHHPVQGVEIIPAAVLMNTFFEALAQAGVTGTGGGRPALTDVALRVPVSPVTPRDIQLSLQDSSLRLSSRIAGEDPDADDSWLNHTTAAVDPSGGVSADRFDAGAARVRCAEPVSTDHVLERVAALGVSGMGFPWEIEELRRGDGELFAVIDTGADGPRTWGSLLDGAMTVTSVLFLGEPVLRMPSRIERLALVGEPPRRAYVRVRVADGPAGVDTLDVAVADLDGRTIAEVNGIKLTVLAGDPGTTINPRQLVYEIVWRPLALPEPRGLDVVVTVGGADHTRLAISAQCAAAGVPFEAVDTPSGLDHLRVQFGRSSAVLVLLDGDSGTDSSVAAAAHRSVWTVADTARRLAGDRAHPRLWTVTTGVREGVSHAALAQSAAWGAARVVAGEHPELWGGIVDLDPSVPVNSSQLLQVVSARPPADVVTVRDGVLETARLAPAGGSPVRRPLECRPEGTYLITGGLGALGLEVARWLAGRGARRLVLAARRPFPARERWAGETDPAVRAQIAAVRALEALGVVVSVVSLDIADLDQTRAALTTTALGLPPIRGVVHAAGVVDSRMIGELDEESLATVLRPKVDGALVLHELFPPGAVDFLVLFSSCGYLFQFPGQASYGSANAFLDGLARHRRASGHDDTVSLGWTSWHGLGMSAASEFIAAELGAFGHTEISATDALRAWEFAERYPAPYYAIFRMASADGVSRRLPLAQEVLIPGDGTEQADAGADWAAVDPAELREQLIVEVRKQVAGELKMAPDDLPLRKPLLEMGLDSVMTVSVRRRLERMFRLPLPATLLWNRPTVVEIAEFVNELLVPTGDDVVPAVAV
jgi:6-methylsalicylic acid synthase